MYKMRLYKLGLKLAENRKTVVTATLTGPLCYPRLCQDLWDQKEKPRRGERTFREIQTHAGERARQYGNGYEYLIVIKIDVYEEF